MSMTAYRSAVVAKLAATFPTCDVAGHSGRFNLATLKAFSLKAPAIRVAVLGVRQTKPQAGGCTEARLAVGVYLVTRDTPPVPAVPAVLDDDGAVVTPAVPMVPPVSRDEAALTLVDALIDLLDREQFIPSPEDPDDPDWEPPFRSHLATNITAQNLYDAETQGVGVALWALGYEQVIVIGADTDESPDLWRTDGPADPTADGHVAWTETDLPADEEG